MVILRQRAIVFFAAAVIGGAALSVGVATIVGGFQGLADSTTLDDTVGRIADNFGNSAVGRFALGLATQFRATLVFALGIATFLAIRSIRPASSPSSFWAWWHCAVLCCGIQGATKALDLHRAVLMGRNSLASPEDIVYRHATAQGGAVGAILVTAAILAASARVRRGSWPSDSDYFWRSGLIVVFCAADWMCLWFWYSW